MALTMWGQVIIQATMPAEAPVQVGTIWVDTSGTATAKVCTSVSPYTFVALSSGTVASHNHTSTADDGGVLTNDEHDGYSEYAAISNPSTPAAGKLRLFAKTTQAHTLPYIIDQDGMVLSINKELVLLVRNVTGSQIDKGKFVDLNGSSGNIPTIQLADADAYDSGRPRHAEGVALENIANNGYGLILTAGTVSNIDTSGVSAEGVAVYLSTTAGGFTETAPTGSTAFVQRLGVVTNKHATQGSIELQISAPERVIGSDTQVLFNDGGTPAGDAGLTYNKTTDALTLAGLFDISGAAAGQIKFPASMNASADANTLDDYEEGSWTPGLDGNGGASGQAYSVQVGRYVKVGKQVTAWCRVTLSTLGTITGFVQVTGLPFTSENTSNLYGGGQIFYWTALTTAVVHMGVAVNVSDNKAALYATTAAATAAGTLAQADLSNTTDFILAITYRAV